MIQKQLFPESQKREYKASWQDEYMQCICGFANSQGGELFIGVNDDGYIVGLKDSKLLLDVLPNQINSTLGIVVDIDYNCVLSRGENIKYSIVPENIAQKPANLYACGLLTLEVLREINNNPENTNTVSSQVQALFDVAPGLVKQLRTNKETRERMMEDFRIMQSNNHVYVETDGSLQFVCITVPAYPYGISYHGHYYVRSGGTTKELSGFALSSFLMDRAGKHWDGVAMPGVTVVDLDSSAIEAYRKKAYDSKRRTIEEVKVSDEQVISDLKLVYESSERKGELTRAAVLLFHPEPERYISGASIRIAYFAPEGAYGANKENDIIYQDEVHGPIIFQADRIVNLVFSKYLKALVSYDGLQRTETYMISKAIFREVILNAINHKMYESGNPIQISVYEDRISVFNQGHWPEDIDTNDVYTKKHSSFSHNPSISHVFYNAGEVEAYGTGFMKIKIECDRINAPYPELTVTPNGVTVEIKACDLYMKLLRYGRYWETYPEYKTKETGFVESNDGEVLTDYDDVPFVYEVTKDIEPSVIASLDHMMEVLSKELSESEKMVYLPIVDYLKTHETIKNADVMRLTEKKSTSANRYLQRLVELEVLVPEGKKKGRVYRRVSE